MRRCVVLAVVAIISTLLIPGEVVRAVSLPTQAADKAEEHTHGPDGLALDPRGRRTEAALAVDEALAPTGWEDDAFERPAATLDAPDAQDLAGKPQVHLVYVFPKDKPSRYSTFVRMFQADARAASELLNSLYGRRIRFDEWTPASGTRYLDITELKSRYSAKQLAGGQQFNYVHDDLVRAYPSAPNKKFVAWLDAGSRYCGQGHLYQDTQRSLSNASNVNRTTGIVYRPYDSSSSTGGFCRGRTFMHELGHNLGAVQKAAPSAFDGAHCNDDDNDVMCYTAQAPLASPSPQFDYGNNDYWDRGAMRVQNADGLWTSGYPVSPSEKLPWWSLSLSRYLCPLVVSSTAEGVCSQENSAPGY